jgi:hypothetical protein
LLVILVLMKNLILSFGSLTLVGGIQFKLYMGLSTMGVKQIFTPLVWKLQVPPRIHIFLWLLTKNKILTRDNLSKRKKLDDITCLFCTEFESVRHLFFECCVAQNIWETISDMLGF